MTVDTQDVKAFPWWLVLLQGIAAIILGILLLSSPGKTTLILIQVLGIYWLIDGIFSLIQIFLKTSDLHWGWLLAKGILGILAGLLVLQNPLWSGILVPTVMIIILGVWGLIGGGIGLIQAFKGGGWGVGILGVIGIVFGLLLIFNPLMGALVLPWVVGIWAIVGGIFALFAAFKLK